MEAPANLASNEFWEEDYYRGLELPVRPDRGYPFERCMMRALEQLAPLAKGAAVLEIGCAPARWLVWYAERFGADVTGIESSPKGAALSRENLAAAGMKGEIHEGDFLVDELRQFDLVFSLGVIEHFADVATAFARHVAFVREGGRLVVGVPNFRGAIGFLQRWADADFLALHNQRAMDPRLYVRLAGECGMRCDTARYIGGLDPDLVKVSRLSARLALMPLRALRMLPPTDQLNGRFTSSYLMMAFTKL